MDKTTNYYPHSQMFYFCVNKTICFNFSLLQHTLYCDWCKRVTAPNTNWTEKDWFLNQPGMENKSLHTCKCSLWKLLYIWFWEKSLLARTGWQICGHVHYFRVTLGFRSNALEKNIPVFLWLSNVFYILLQACLDQWEDSLELSQQL